MIGNAYFDRDDARITLASARGECAAPGPWATVCNEDAFHRYSHYDAQADTSWQDDWRQDGPAPEDPTAREWLPEDGDTRCQECGRRNPVWWAADGDWSRLMPNDGVLCPTCYHARWLATADQQILSREGDQE